MAFGKATRRETPEPSLDLSERLSPYGEHEADAPGPETHRQGDADAAVRLVIVDDLPAIRTMLSLAASLFDGVTVVGEAGGAAEAVEVCTDVQPDAILLDVEMPQVDGIAAIPLLRAAAPKAKIAMYSNDNASRHAALDAGADAFYLKLDLRPAELLSEIVRLCEGRPN